MDNLIIATKYKDRELKKIKTYIQKKGLEIDIFIPFENSDNLNEVDIFNDDIDIIGEKQQIRHNYSYGESDKSKCVFINDDNTFKAISDLEIESNENTNIEVTSDIYIDYDKILPIGTKIQLLYFENMSFLISEITKNRSETNVYRYKVNRA
jgi:hypothetical protein